MCDGQKAEMAKMNKDLEEREEKLKCMTAEAIERDDRQCVLWSASIMNFQSSLSCLKGVIIITVLFLQVTISLTLSERGATLCSVFERYLDFLVNSWKIRGTKVANVADKKSIFESEVHFVYF